MLTRSAQPGEGRYRRGMTTITKVQREWAARQERERQRALRRQELDQSRVDQLMQDNGIALCVLDLDGGRAHFGYTIGLTAQGLPELCIQGGDKGAMKAMLNYLPFLARELGQPLENGAVLRHPSLPDKAVLLSAASDDDVAAMLYARQRYTFFRALRASRLA